MKRNRSRTRAAEMVLELYCHNVGHVQLKSPKRHSSEVQLKTVDSSRESESESERGREKELDRGKESGLM